MLSFFGWKWANVFFYIFLIWICSGLLLHLCIFHIYITLNDLTTYEYVRAQRDETGRDRYRILPKIWGKREETGRDSKNLEVQGFEYTVFHSDVLKFIFNTLTPQSQTLCNVHDTAVSSSMVSLAHWVKLCSVIDTAESESIVSI